MLGRGLSALGTPLAPGGSLDTNRRVTEAQGPPHWSLASVGRAGLKVAEWQGGAGEAGGCTTALSPSAAPPHRPPPHPAHPATHGLQLRRRMRADLGIRDVATESPGKQEKGVARQPEAQPRAPLSPAVTGTRLPPPDTVPRRCCPRLAGHPHLSAHRTPQFPRAAHVSLILTDPGAGLLRALRLEAVVWPGLPQTASAAFPLCFYTPDGRRNASKAETLQTESEQASFSTVRSKLVPVSLLLLKRKPNASQGSRGEIWLTEQRRWE